MTDAALPPPALVEGGIKLMRGRARMAWRHPGRLDVHLLRLKAAVRTSGAELTQGVLADLFFGCGDLLGPAERRAALETARPRLSPLSQKAFEAQVPRCTLARSNPLATRYSVLTTPTLQLPQRAARGTSDDAKARAQAAIQAWRAGDPVAQQDFLAHCRVCRDVLAFSLARREILREGRELPSSWSATFNWLQAQAIEA